MNRIILIGNIASDIEHRTTQSGISNATFRIAVQRRYKSQDGQREADFLPVVCWRQTADFVSKYLSKGSKIALEGMVQTRSYDAQDGSKRYVTEIIADHVEGVGSREDRPQKAEAANGGYVDVTDEDGLPFD